MGKRALDAIRAWVGGRRGFLLLCTAGFAACFLLSELGRVRHLRWLTGWPPLLFVFTVPPEFRWRFTRGPWVREVFLAMTEVTTSGLAVAALVETALARRQLAAPPPLGPALMQLVPIVVIGGVLFGVLSLFSAWGLYNVLFRPDSGRARGREGKSTEDKT